MYNRLSCLFIELRTKYLHVWILVTERIINEGIIKNEPVTYW